MPVSQRDADTMLEEFLAQREVTKIRRGAKGPKQPSTKPDPLERTEYAPDNSRIGNDSRGLQSDTLVGRMFDLGYPQQAIAHTMVSEYFMGMMGCSAIVPQVITL
jgi:hypothetical protein